jgi:magnesium transporter
MAINNDINFKKNSIDLGNYTWYNFSSITKKELSYIYNKFNIWHKHLKMVRPIMQRPKFIKTPQYVLVILQYPAINLENNNNKELIMKTNEIDIFIGDNFILTFHDNYKPINDLYNKIRKDKSTQLKKFHNQPSKLMHDLILDPTDTLWQPLDKIARNFENLKKRALIVTDKTIISEILKVKSMITNIRGVMQFQKNIIKRLKYQAINYFDNTATERFNRLIEVSSDLWEYLDNYKETINAIHDTHVSASANRLKEIMKILTMFSVFIIPITVISAIWGLSNMPLEYKKTTYFWPLITLNFILMFALYLYFKRKKWL